MKVQFHVELSPYFFGSNLLLIRDSFRQRDCFTQKSVSGFLDGLVPLSIRKIGGGQCSHEKVLPCVEAPLPLSKFPKVAGKEKCRAKKLHLETSF